MDITDRDIKRIAVLFLIVVLGVLIFLLIRPILFSILGGLILAYAFLPVYRQVVAKVGSKNLAASLVSILVLALIVVPAYFIIPLMVKQVFELFVFTQEVNIQAFLQGVFPQASEQFIVQATTGFKSVTSQISASSLNALVNFFLEVPTLVFNMVIVAFVFFYSLRDADKLKKFVSDLSPLHENQERRIVREFKDITNAIVYGQVFIGLAQGIAAGIGLLIFGIPGAIVLTLLSIVLSIIPILGPTFVWAPAAVYLFFQGSTTAGVLFLVYNILFVSNIDNLLRLYIVAKRTSLSQVIVLIGMIGGFLIFGILGLVLGPLILAYFIIFLEAYRKNTLSGLFKHEPPPKVRGK